MTNLDRNMKALKDTHPHTAELLKQGTDADWLTTVKCESGATNVLIAYGASREPAHPMTDPVKEERDQLKKIKHQLARDEVSILVGLGAGHGAAAIFNECEKGHTVVVVEPVVEFLTIAFGEHDYSDNMRAGRLFFCCSGDRNELAQIIGTIDERTAPRDWFMSYLPHVTRRREYAEALRDVSEVVNSTRCNSGTVVSAGAQIATNDIDTIPYLYDKRGIIELVDKFKGKPAVVVCTGPSLARNIHILAERQDEVVIVAVGQAIRILLAHDIKPDFACTVDFGEVNFSHFDRLMDCGVPLITINRTYAPLVAQWQGPLFVINGAPGLDGRLSGIFNDRGMVPQGGSVAHMAFQVALALGCKTVMLVGQDLALPDGQSHTKQVDSGGTVSVTERGEIRWKVEDPSSIIKEGDHSMGPAIQIPGYYGEPVLTNVGLQSFRAALEQMIKAIPDSENITVINATEGGANINGAMPMWLDDALSEYANAGFDKTLDTELLKPLADSEALRKKTLKFARAERKEMTAARKALNAVKKNLKELKKADDLIGPPRMKQIKGLLAENRKLNNTAHGFVETTPVLGVATYHAERAIRSRAMNMTTPIEVKTRANDSHKQREKKRRTAMRNHLAKKANRDDLLHLIKRNEHVLNAVLDAIKKVNSSLGVVINILNANEPITHATPDPLTNDQIEAYFDAGNYSFPLVEARRTDQDIVGRTYYSKAKKMRSRACESATEQHEKEREDGRDTKPRYHYYVTKAQHIGATTRDFEKAIPFLRQALEIDPEGEQARRGLASALLLTGQYHEATTLFGQLVLDFPDNHRYNFEFGQAAIMADKVAAGIAAINEAVKEDPDQFMPFLPAVGDLYMEKGLHERAVDVYQQYLDVDRFKHDATVWEKMATCFKALDRKSNQKEARRHVKRLREGQ